MAEITKDIYAQYAKKIVSVLDNDEFYNKFKTRVDSGAASFKLAKKRLIQDIDIEWIETIEDVLPNLDTIVRNPRKFIVQEEDIVDISLARSISTESVKHLAQHTNMISKVDKDGTVTPNRILNITKEESYEIYENRFIYTLLLKLKDFVTMRYDKIKKASATQDVLELDVESRFNLPSKKITYKTNYFAQLSFDEVMQLDPDTLTKIERVAKIDRIITDFLSSSFAKQMRSSAPVRPPIQRTNVILKEPNFKKALTLWQFVETYQREAGFSTSDDVEDYEITDEDSKNLYNMVTLNTMLFESMYDEHETDMDMEDKDFADFATIGNMDFKADELNKEEFGQKVDEEFDKEEEKEKEEIETVEAEQPEDADMQTKEETPPPPEEKEPEEPETTEVEKETPPEEIEVEKETPQPEPIIIEVEKEVEKVVEVEMPPKEFIDREPEGEDFDKYLFDVRKLYKLPKEDKLRQDELQKCKDAIDRCLVSYRKIKQEILDIRIQEYQEKKKREEARKKASLYREQQENILRDYKDGDLSYFGIDPLSGKKRKKKEEKIKLPKNEHINLEDKDLDNIQKAYDEMDRKSTVTYKEEEELNMNTTKKDTVELKTTALSSNEIEYTEGGIRTGNMELDHIDLSSGIDPYKEIEKKVTLGKTEKVENKEDKKDSATDKIENKENTKKPRKPRKKVEKATIDIEVGHAELTKQDAKEITNKNTYDFNLGSSSINLNNPYESMGVDIFGGEDLNKPPKHTEPRPRKKKVKEPVIEAESAQNANEAPKEVENSKESEEKVAKPRKPRKKGEKATIEVEVGHAELTKQDAKEITNNNTYDINIFSDQINLNNPYESIAQDIFGDNEKENIKPKKKATKKVEEKKEKVEKPEDTDKTTKENQSKPKKSNKKAEKKVDSVEKKKEFKPKTMDFSLGNLGDDPFGPKL